MTSKEYEERIRKAKEKAKRNKERWKSMGISSRQQEWERKSRRLDTEEQVRRFRDYDPYR